ncbi:MAG: nucleotidyltransferase family protein [Clostridiales bacterium]|nr:nucleotidyltransferase family protein [Clostridiales bacterium]
MQQVGAVILAAGLSSRMGAYKPLLQIDGVSMIRRVYDAMSAAGADPIVVVTGYRHGDIEAHLRGLPVSFVHNPEFAHTQQLDSLRLGLDALKGRCRRVLISPADVPLVSRETVDALLRAEGDFIRPVYQGRPGHPVVLDAALIPALRRYNGDGGLRDAIEHSGAAICDVPVPDEGVALDADTPQDFQALLRWRQRQR